MDKAGLLCLRWHEEIIGGKKGNNGRKPGYAPFREYSLQDVPAAFRRGAVWAARECAGGEGYEERERARQLGSFALFDFFWRAFATATIWLGIASLLTFFVAYMVVLSWADYSFVQPASAVSYGIVALLSFFLLHEVVKPLQRHGVSIISCGVLIVGNTAPRTTKRN